ncbi:MAG: PorT family protein [Flavobacteriia bacterium]|nr:PorT family protein [Flavobacteriia bacterium]OIP46033.1 MAG: PorT protein [Flavobacteriaceae bacterium CG2_30_31_66]PIV95927.1 MAG: PorT protein [Flavobacteriaceae bacterium CG17_big_fil_post_rev_8_21_14_2_50_31_13]PIX14350.1 MAG: PorT protein [Flavobacteriaceae bacterium CG_4_8_14_3_um_filter_31_8]PIY15412.1 MAG: PorT protein [Flavobacteriaceae bacterium CG_4_10_14_3_um_filter_31_253]PIZ11179.1 MAG: PorT protein [Flavobacteriaceae bacterium CG_4_10_14_0_8_um_filter_31_99]PJC09665.1 MAG: 
MKNKIFLGFFFLISVVVFAQRERVENLPTFDQRKLHYGFYLGLNQNDFKLNLRNSSIANADITVSPSAGFNVGLIADLRFHKNLNLRFEPGLVTNSKKIYFNHLVNPRDSVREIGSTYLHVPVLLKFSTDRYKNIRPYVLGGISYDYNFSSNEANQDDNSSGEFRMKTHNFMYEVGVGIDIYLYFFKFSPSIRGVFAINNEVKYDDNPNSQWTSPINFMGTRGVFLTFAFE